MGLGIVVAVLLVVKVEVIAELVVDRPGRDGGEDRDVALAEVLLDELHAES